MTREELLNGFKEFNAYHGQCRFNNCRHISEPDCAIQQAVEAGAISQARYASYARLLDQTGSKL